MSMQVTKPFVIKLIFKDTPKTYTVSSFIAYETQRFMVSDFIDLKRKYGKAIAFKLIELNVPTDSIKLINWLQQEFKFMFDYDPLLWLASVATLPAELHQYLIPFHKDIHDNSIS